MLGVSMIQPIETSLISVMEDLTLKIASRKHLTWVSNMLVFKMEESALEEMRLASMERPLSLIVLCNVAKRVQGIVVIVGEIAFTSLIRILIFQAQ